MAAKIYAVCKYEKVSEIQANPVEHFWLNFRNPMFIIKGEFHKEVYCGDKIQCQTGCGDDWHQVLCTSLLGGRTESPDSEK